MGHFQGKNTGWGTLVSTSAGECAEMLENKLEEKGICRLEIAVFSKVARAPDDESETFISIGKANGFIDSTTA